MDEFGVEVWRGGVATWEGDLMGHLNVRFYVAKAMEALAGLAAELGMRRAFSASAESTLVVREQHLRFRREVQPGAQISISAGVVEMGETDARLMLLMRHDSGQVAAGFQTLVSHVTARDLRPFAWSQRVRDRAAALKVEVPEAVSPRSIALDPPRGEASLARAQALGLLHLTRGVVLAEDCDAFGRMRAEQFMARISDGMPRISRLAEEEPSAGTRTSGGAALEYRLVYRAWPRAGDRVAIYSGLAGLDARTRRYVHWMVDPDEGHAWGMAESVGAGFDLKTRRLLESPPKVVEALRGWIVPGLSV